MTTDTTTATPAEQPEVEESTELPELAAAIESAAAPAKITLKYLLESVEGYKLDQFEEWASDFYSEAQRRLAKARVRLFRMERLGLATETLQAERTRLNHWDVQMIQAQFLAGANIEEPELDYTAPITLKYFALWLWDTDHGKCEHPDPSPYTYGPLDWALYLDEELLSLASFGLR